MDRPTTDRAGDSAPEVLASVAVVIVDHGSRRTESNESLEAFVRASADRLPYPIVEPAHMELAEPSIGTAFDRCVAAGATTVALAPYFLGPGSHWDRDIPALAAEAAARHPGVRWLVAAPLGPHPLLMDVVDRRVAHCLAHVSGAAGPCSACAGSDRCVLR
ncbi:MAG: CbiX/SirB N-terminal domain-containing protein [Acidimicrobiales bacterium]|jgi:sirohydrochlorin ferrochelatase